MILLNNKFVNFNMKYTNERQMSRCWCKIIALVISQSQFSIVNYYLPESLHKCRNQKNPKPWENSFIQNGIYSVLLEICKHQVIWFYSTKIPFLDLNTSESICAWVKHLQNLYISRWMSISLVSFWISFLGHVC